MITTERADNFTEQLLSDETELIRNATPNSDPQKLKNSTSDDRASNMRRYEKKRIQDLDWMVGQPFVTIDSWQFKIYCKVNKIRGVNAVLCGY